MGDRQISPEPQKRLTEIKPWMDLPSEMIVGTQPGLEPWQFYGSSTRKGDRLCSTDSVRGMLLKRI